MQPQHSVNPRNEVSKTFILPKCINEEEEKKSASEQNLCYNLAFLPSQSCTVILLSPCPILFSHIPEGGGDINYSEVFIPVSASFVLFQITAAHKFCTSRVSLEVYPTFLSSSKWTLKFFWHLQEIRIYFFSLCLVVKTLLTWSHSREVGFSSLFIAVMSWRALSGAPMPSV